MPEQLSFPSRLELADFTAAELQALSPEACFALLPDYTADELHALKSAYFNEWMDLTNYLLDRWLVMPKERLHERQARLAEVHRRCSLLNDFHWWKSSGASLEQIQKTFEERRAAEEYERQYDEEWKARDAADLAAGKPWHVWQQMKKEKERGVDIFCQ